MSLSSIFGKITDWLKISPQFLLAISLITASLLFLRGNVMTVLSLEYFRTQYRTYIGLIFLISTALFISYPIRYVFLFLSTGIKEITDELIERRNFKKWCTRLTPKQKRLLRLFIENDIRSMSLDFTDGAVTELMNAHFIYLPTNMQLLDSFRGAMLTTFTMNAWIFDYLKEHPEVLV